MFCPSSDHLPVQLVGVPSYVALLTALGAITRQPGWALVGALGLGYVGTLWVAGSQVGRYWVPVGIDHFPGRHRPAPPVNKSLISWCGGCSVLVIARSRRTFSPTAPAKRRAIFETRWHKAPIDARLATHNALNQLGGKFPDRAVSRRVRERSRGVATTDNLPWNGTRTKPKRISGRATSSSRTPSGHLQLFRRAKTRNASSTDSWTCLSIWVEFRTPASSSGFSGIYG